MSVFSLLVTPEQDALTQPCLLLNDMDLKKGTKNEVTLDNTKKRLPCTRGQSSKVPLHQHWADLGYCL